MFLNFAVCIALLLKTSISQYINLDPSNPIFQNKFTLSSMQGYLRIIIYHNYSPLKQLIQIGSIEEKDTQDSLIAYIMNESQGSIAFASYLTLDQNLKSITQNFYIFSNGQQSTLSYTHQNVLEYEGVWIQQELIISESSFQIIMLDYASFNQLYFYEEQFPLSIEENFKLQFGGILDNKPLLLKQFKGMMQINLINYDNSYENLFLLCPCYWYPYEYISSKLSITQINYNLFYANNYTCSQFYFRTWAKMDETTDFINAYIIHLDQQSFLDYSNQVGGTTFQLQYIYDSKNNIYYLKLKSYSYNFPITYAIEDSKQFEDLIEIQNNIFEWHYFTVTYNKQELSLLIEYFKENQQISKQYENIYYFSNTNMKIYLGGTPIEFSQSSGILVQTIYETCPFRLIELTKCHYSCIECFGPYDNNCFNCDLSSFRTYDEQLKTCSCIFGYLETGNLICYSPDSNYNRIQTPLSSNIGYDYDDPVYCAYGYYLYQNECRQCPQIEIGILCFECLKNPENWADDPSCSDLRQTDNNELYTYQYQDPFYIMTFVDGELILTRRNSLNPSYTDICVKVSEDSNYCFSCIDSSKYYLSVDRKVCNECLIPNCKYCFSFNSYDRTINSLESYALQQFFTQSQDDIIGCALCFEGYQFNFQNIQCEQRTPTYPCLEDYIDTDGKIVCLITDTQDFSLGNAISNCEQLILNCFQCIKTYQNVPKCVKCDTGYYIDILSGKCFSCTEMNPYTIDCYQKDFSGSIKDYFKEILNFYNAFVPGKKYFNDIPFSTILAATSCKSNYKIYYQHCVQSTDDGCLVVQEIEDIYKCLQCSDGKYGIKRLTLTQDQTCVSCPNFCELCITRTTQEIQLINPYFQVTDQNQPMTNRCLKKTNLPHLFLDNKIGLVKICENLEKCKSKIIQRIDYMQSYFQLNALWYLNPNAEYLNYWQFDTITFHYIFYQDQVETTSQHTDVIYSSYQQILVFSLQFSELILEGNTGQYISLSFGYIKFRFRNLTFINLNLLFSLAPITVIYCYSEIGINIYLQHLLISYSNIDSLPIETAKFNRKKWFEIYNLEVLEAKNLVIQDVYLVNSIFFNITGSDSMEMQIESVVIQNCTFINSTLFQFQQKMAQFKLKDIQFINCTFQNSSIISTKIYYLEIDILIQIIQLNNIIVKESVLFDLPISKLVTLEQLTIGESDFSGSTIISLKNNVYFQQILVQNCYFSSSTIIINVNTIVQSQIVSIIMDQIRIENIKYDSMKIIKLFPLDTIQFNINLMNFHFSNIGIENILLINRKIKSSLNYLQGETLIMQNFYLERQAGFIDFYLSLFQSLVIDNMIVKKSSEFTQQYIQLNQECVQQNTGHSQLLAINGVFHLQISNLLVQDQFLEDQILLQIYNTQDTYNFENSTILIRDCQFIGNSLIKIQKQLQVSLISINYQSCKLIKIFNLEIRLTWLNQYSQDPQSTSRSSLMTIYSNQQTVQLEQINLMSNILTNSTDPLIQLYSNDVTINNVYAFEANYLNFEQFKFRMMLNQNINLTLAQLRKQFPINSYGGVFAISGESIVVSNSQFNTTRALQGGVLYCVLQQNSVISIFNIIIQDSQTTLENEPNSQGGSFYIDASRATANIEIINVKIMQSFSRFSGGFVKINPSITVNNYLIKNIYLENCYSLYNSLIFVEFNVLYAVKNFIVIQNVEIKIDEFVYNQFLNNIGYDSKQQTLVDGIGQIYLKYGNISLINITYTGLIVQPLIEIITLSELIMESINILNVQFMVPYFIKIQIYRDQTAFIKLQNLKIYNASQFNYDDRYSLTSCTKLQQETLNILPNCLNQKLSFNINDNVDEQISELAQYCNQQYLANQDVISLIVISITVQQYLIIQSLRYFNVKCESCLNGLMFIKGNILLQKMVIKESLFQNNICGLSGCLKIEGNQQINVLIDNSRMTTNRATNGSGILIDFNDFNQEIDNSSMIVQNSYFSKNQATNFGGALYINQEDQSLFNIFNSILDRNQAYIGGALYFTKISPSLSSVQLTQNFGSNSLNNIGSAIYKLKLSINDIVIPSITLLTTDGSTIEIPDYQSVKMQDNFLRLPTGQQIGSFKQFVYSSLDLINLTLSLQLLAENQVQEQITSVQDSQCQLFHREVDPNNELEVGPFIQDNSLSLNGVSFNHTSHSFNLDSLIIVFNPYLKKLLEIDVNCTNFQIHDYHYRFRVQTYKCQQGEVFANNSCNLCDASKGFYSTSPFQNECQRIDIMKISNNTSGMLKLNQGYWRPNYKSNEIEYCTNNPNDCIGGWNVSNSLCGLSKVGALCEQCDISNLKGQGKYSRQSQSTCYSCSAITDQVLVALGISFWTLFLVTMTVQSINNSNLELSKLKNFTKHFDIIFRKNQDQTGSLIKMATNYLQIIQIIYTFQAKFFIDSSQFVLIASNPVQQVTYNLDCSLADISPTNLIYIRIIWIILLPFCYFPIFTTFYFIVIKYKKVKFDFGVVATTLIYLFIYTQPNLIQELVQLFSIRRISGMQWIKADVSYLYYTDLHVNWVLYFIVPVMILYGLLIPCIIAYKLVQNRKQLNNLRVRTVWAYVYNEYTKKSFFWEIIRIFQRELIIVIITYFDQNILLKGCLTILTILIYLGIVINLAPYNQASLNIYEQRNIFLCIIIILLCLILKNVQDNLLSQLEMTVQILLIIALISLFYNIISKILTAYYQKMDQTLDPIRVQLLKIFPRLANSCFFFKKYLRIKVHQKELIRNRFQLIKKHFKTTALQTSRKSVIPPDLVKNEIFTQRNELMPLDLPLDSIHSQK